VINLGGVSAGAVAAGADGDDWARWRDEDGPWAAGCSPRATRANVVTPMAITRARRKATLNFQFMVAP